MKYKQRNMSTKVTCVATYVLLNFRNMSTKLTGVATNVLMNFRNMSTKLIGVATYVLMNFRNMSTKLTCVATYVLPNFRNMPTKLTFVATYVLRGEGAAQRAVVPAVDLVHSLRRHREPAVAGVGDVLARQHLLQSIHRPVDAAARQRFHARTSCFFIFCLKS